MKKILMTIWAAIMVLSMSTNTFAATVDNHTGHSYKAYQIFSGTQADGDAALGDIEWGTGIEPVTFLYVLQHDDRFKRGEENIFMDCETAKDVAEVLNEYNEIAENFANAADLHLTGVATEIAKDATDITLPAGYYLLVDTEEIADGTNGARNSALLQLTNYYDIEMSKKYDLPTSDKDITKVTDVNMNTKFEGTTEVVDAEIGDIIEFTLAARLPSNLNDYEIYHFAFHDNLSEGMELLETEDNIRIFRNGTEDITFYFEISNEANEKGNLHIECEYLKDIYNLKNRDFIVVKYSAKLTDKAVIGSTGNPNTMYVEYSNNPNHDGDGQYGKTPEDEVIVFTYELDVNKVDGSSSDKLKDAEFVLLNADKTKVATVVNSVLTGWETVPTAGEDGKITWPADTTLKSDANGQFIIKGLDSATYYLRETKAPAGYNLLTDDVKLVITATLTPDKDEEREADLTALKIQVGDNGEQDGTLATGIVEANIANNKGAVLPETGGMGTTIFYIVGAVLVLGAGVFLVTKKRMEY